MLRFFSYILLIVFTTSAVADGLKIIGIQGASRVQNENGLMTVYGGVAGAACQGDGTSTCNSCSAQVTNSCKNPDGIEQFPLCSCHRERIYDSLRLHFILQTDSKRKGVPQVLISSGALPPVYLEVSANDGQSVDILWSQICRAIHATSCDQIEFDLGAMLTIGIPGRAGPILSPEDPQIQVQVRVVRPGNAFNVFGQPTSEGIGQFHVYAGSRKAYIENLILPVTFPILSYGSQAQAVRVYVSDQSLESATPQSASQIEDLIVSNQGSNLNTNSIPGLENGKSYFFRIALLDQAGNVVQFTPPFLNAPQGCSAQPPEDCPYSTTPTAKPPNKEVLARLQWAIQRDRVNEVRDLIEELGRVDEPFNAIEETPLTLSALNVRYHIVRLLLQLGANVNHQTTNGYTALMFASYSKVDHETHNNLKTVRLLLAAGANKRLRNAEGATAYDLAVAAHNDSVAKLLK